MLSMTAQGGNQTPPPHPRKCFSTLTILPPLPPQCIYSGSLSSHCQESPIYDICYLWYLSMKSLCDITWETGFKQTVLPIRSSDSLLGWSSFLYLMELSISNHIDSICSLPFWKHLKVESILSNNLQEERRKLLLPWE